MMARMRVARMSVVGGALALAAGILGPGIPQASATPSSPTGVTVTRADTALSVSWTASSGATSYTATAYDALSGGVTQGTACTIATTSCAISGLTNGTLYYVEVVATDGSATAASTPRVSGTPSTVPGAPQSVVVTGGDGSMAVAWSAPASTGGAPITGYEATAYDASSGGTSQGTCTATGTTCTVSGLTNGTTYYVEVTATNTAGTGAASSRASGLAGGSASAPRSVTATRGDGHVDVEWLAPSSDGGAAVTSYIASAYTSSATSATAVATCTTTSLECRIDGLANATEYYVSVAAVTAVRTGTSSSRVRVSAAGAPGAPASVVATRGNGYAAVSWRAPTTTGGSRITRYVARAYTVLTEGGPIATCEPTTVKPTQCDIGPLPNGSKYYIDVTATNAIGLSTTSTPRVAVTTATTPNVPTEVVAVQVGPRVDVSWRVPASDGGLSISEYVATAYSLATGGVSLGSCSATGASCSITGLADVPVFVDVVAVTGAGRGQPSTPRVRVVLYDPPDQVRDIAGSPSGRSMNVSWQPPADDGRRAITSYRATAWDAATGGSEKGSCVLGVNAARPGPAAAGSESRVGCTIKGLTPGASYHLAVEVTTVVDSVESKERVSVPLKEGLPSAPRGATLLVGDHLIAAVGQVPSTDGGSPVTKYVARAWSQKDAGEVLAQCSKPADATQSQFSCVLSDLDNFEPYWIDVAAVTEAGTGKWTPRALTEPQPSAPSAPRGVRVEEREGSIRVSWRAPIFDGGYDVRSYEARVYPTDSTGAKVSTTPSRTCEVKAPVTSCVLSGFSDGQYLRVDVTAENTVGKSKASAQADATIVPSVPSAPTKVVAQVVGDAVKISWMAPPGTGSLPVLGYRATVMGQDGSSRPLGSCEVTTLQCTVKVLKAMKATAVEVQARNELGWGDTARTEMTTSPALAPGSSGSQ